eukprot:3494795-Rhodomonas_salina.2
MVDVEARGERRRRPESPAVVDGSIGGWKASVRAPAMARERRSTARCDATILDCIAPVHFVQQKSTNNATCAERRYIEDSTHGFLVVMPVSVNRHLYQS